MKVKELIEKLNTYNPDATIEVVVNGYPEEFEICYGYSEGCTKESCENVSLHVNTPTENTHCGARMDGGKSQ